MTGTTYQPNIFKSRRSSKESSLSLSKIVKVSVHVLFYNRYLWGGGGGKNIFEPRPSN